MLHTVRGVTLVICIQSIFAGSARHFYSFHASQQAAMRAAFDRKVKVFFVIHMLAKTTIGRA